MLKKQITKYLKTKIVYLVFIAFLLSLTVGQTSVAGIEIDELSVVGDEVNQGYVAITDDGFLMKSSATVGNALEERKESFAYTVKAGDTLASLSDTYGISVNTLKYANKMTNNYITKGQDIVIPAKDGVVYTVKKGETLDSIASSYSIDKETIIAYNENALFKEGEQVFLAGAAPKWSDIPRTEYLASRDTRFSVDTTNVAYVPGAMRMPAEGIITQGFRRGHYAIDIAKRGGTTVHAAKGGVVKEIATWGWNYGYGNYVLVDHGDGVLTRYAHLAKVYVEPGQTVGKGSPLGYMGNTGRSSGTHLHFEVIVSGYKKNPFAYIK